MSTPADQRLMELLDRWLASLDLHVKYSSLDDDTYWKVQPWVEHQRPSRWIVDLARQKTAALKTQVEQRVKTGDASFSDALEQMLFLANLVGLQHIERFIPVADPDRERKVQAGETAATTGTRELPRLSTSATGTREMPRPAAPKPRTPSPPSPLVARVERKAASGRQAAKNTSRSAVKVRREPAATAAGATGATAAAEAARRQVIDDAARLLKWGRKWFELAELIARMAGRPPLRDVTRLLNENRSLIEKALSRTET
jgi:hypothetical protein